MRHLLPATRCRLPAKGLSSQDARLRGLSASTCACLIGMVVGGACHESSGDEVVVPPAVATAGDITIENPYAPEPVTPEVGSLYFTLRNHGELPDHLLSIAVDLADDVSLHDQDRSGASMRMVTVESIEVPPGGSVSLEPGGFHAMLRELSYHYRRGDSLSVTIEFANAGGTTFFVPVISYIDVADRMQHNHGEGQH